MGRELGVRKIWGKSEGLSLVLREVQMWREGMGWVASSEGKAEVTGSSIGRGQKMQKAAVLAVIPAGRRAATPPLL